MKFPIWKHIWKHCLQEFLIVSHTFSYCFPLKKNRCVPRKTSTWIHPHDVTTWIQVVHQGRGTWGPACSWSCAGARRSANDKQLSRYGGWWRMGQRNPAPVDGLSQCIPSFTILINILYYRFSNMFQAIFWWCKHIATSIQEWSMVPLGHPGSYINGLTTKYLCGWIQEVMICEVANWGLLWLLQPIW